MKTNKDFELLSKITRNSKLTQKDVDEISRKINKAVTNITNLHK